MKPMKLSERIPHEPECNAVYKPSVEPNECDCWVNEVAQLESALDKALGAIDGEREPCPLCGAMYWAGEFGHDKGCLVYREPLP